jgi:hypothetical protein
MSDFDLVPEDKVKLLLEFPDTFLQLSFAQYVIWSEDIVSTINCMPHNARRKALLAAHRRVTRRLRNRDYARESRALKNIYVKGLEEKIQYLQHEVRRLESLLASYASLVEMPLPPISSPES